MAKEHQSAIIDFIVKQIEAGKKPGSILTAINRKWTDRKLSESTFRRYQREANQIVAERAAARAKADAETDRILRDAEIASAYCDIDERKQLLAKIARGEDLRSVSGPSEMSIEITTGTDEDQDNKKRAKIKTKTTRPIIPTLPVRLSAIEILNKMDGVYVHTINTKQEVEVNYKNDYDLSKLTDAELEQLIKLQSKSGTGAA